MPKGMLVRTPEAVQAAMFVFPLTFASSAFVPVETMPHWLRVFAENQPITIAVDTLRSAVLGRPLGSDAWLTLAWSLGALALFFPLAVLLYQRRTSD
jgi:ABC-type multidrug transport system permease subunit